MRRRPARSPSSERPVDSTRSPAEFERDMNLQSLAEAPFAIQLHLATVLPAFAIGTWQIFFSTKGARLHRALGFTYLTLMTATGGDAFFFSHLQYPGSLT